MSGWLLRVVWPIEDPATFSEESIAAARADLPAIAEEKQATIVGPPRFLAAAGKVVCEVPVHKRVTA